MKEFGPQPHQIKWRTYKGLAGDLQTMLVGEYNGISFSELYNDLSLFNWSFKRKKRIIIKAIQMLHATHWID